MKVSVEVAIKNAVRVQNNVVIPQEGGQPYKGSYEVTPAVDDQTLLTKNRLMMEDLKVKAIPYYETSNLQNGKTIYIG